VTVEAKWNDEFWIVSFSVEMMHLDENPTDIDSVLFEPAQCHRSQRFQI
jgi:hypothetical protein